MDELLEILEDINPAIDYASADGLVTNKLLDSLQIVTLVSEISDVFDIDIFPKYLEPKYFDNVEVMWQMIQDIKEDM